MSCYHDSSLDSNDNRTPSDCTSAYGSGDNLISDDDLDLEHLSVDCNDRLLSAADSPLDPTDTPGGSRTNRRSRYNKVKSFCEAKKVHSEMCYRSPRQHVPSRFLAPLSLDSGMFALGDKMSMLEVGHHLERELSAVTDTLALDVLGGKLSSLRVLTDGISERMVLRRVELSEAKLFLADGNKSHRSTPSLPVKSPKWSDFPPAKAKRAPRSIASRPVDCETFK